MSPLKKPNTVSKLMLHATYLCFSGNAEIILFKKFHTGFVLSQISTFPTLEQRSRITDFCPVCLSDVLSIGGLTPSLGTGLGWGGGVNFIFMSTQPWALPLTNLFFHLLQAINLSLPLALIYNA